MDTVKPWTSEFWVAASEIMTTAIQLGSPKAMASMKNPDAQIEQLFDALVQPNRQGAKEVLMYGMPVITLEVQGMRKCMQKAISDSFVELDSQVQEAIEEACTEENLQAVISQAVSREIKSAVDAAVRRYFLAGDGRFVVMDEIKKRLDVQLETEARWRRQLEGDRHDKEG